MLTTTLVINLTNPVPPWYKYSLLIPTPFAPFSDHNPTSVPRHGLGFPR
jgi:hypothetical protein